MLQVNSTGTTNITVTAYEMASNKVNPYFTFQLQRKGSNDEIIFTADDVSWAPYYWNSYNITVATASLGLTSGLIPLTEGEWNYSIYEMPFAYDLNLDDSIGVVETGILVCGLNFVTTPAPVADNAITPIPVFRPVITTPTTSTTTTTTTNQPGNYYLSLDYNAPFWSDIVFPDHANGVGVTNPNLVGLGSGSYSVQLYLNQYASGIDNSFILNQLIGNETYLTLTQGTNSVIYQGTTAAFQYQTFGPSQSNYFYDVIYGVSPTGSLSVYKMANMDFNTIDPIYISINFVPTT
jgi:hypothetical protein